MTQIVCPRHGPVNPGQVLYDSGQCSKCHARLIHCDDVVRDWRDDRIAYLEGELAEAGRQLAMMRGF